MSLLSWDKPKKLRSTEAHNRKYQSDSGVPGSYVPNMSESDNRAWKAKHLGNTVEIRKLFTERGHWSQVLIVVTEEGVTISTNGKIGMSMSTYAKLQDAINEALAVLREEAEEKAKRTAKPKMEPKPK